MRVNDAKTQLLNISSAGLDSRKYIDIDEKMMTSGEELKILGFYFGPTPGAESHVRNIERKICSRLWILRHLKRARVPPEDLAAVYRLLIHPVICYVAPTYVRVSVNIWSGGSS